MPPTFDQHQAQGLNEPESNEVPFSQAKLTALEAAHASFVAGVLPRLHRLEAEIAQLQADVARLQNQSHGS